MSMIHRIARRRLLAAVTALFAFSACDDPAALTPAGASVTGDVTLESRAPVPGARILLTSAEGELSALSGPDGRFGFQDIAAGEWDVRIEPPHGFESASAGEAALALERNAAVVLNVDLASSGEGGVLAIRVQTETSQPVRGAVVLVLGGIDTIAVGATTSTGDLLLPMSAGSYVVQLIVPEGRAPAGGSPTIHDDVVVSDGATTWLDFTLTEGTGGEDPPTGSGSLAGTVHVGDAPFPGVRVWAIGFGDTLNSAVTDANGRVQWSQVPAGEWIVWTEVPSGYAVAPGQRHPLVADVRDQATTSFSIGLVEHDGAARLDVVVLGDSIPLAGVLVYVMHQDGDASVAAGNTDAGGRFGAELAPGLYAVEIEPPAGYRMIEGETTRQENVELRANATAHTVFYLESL